MCSFYQSLPLRSRWCRTALRMPLVAIEGLVKVLGDDDSDHGISASIAGSQSMSSKRFTS
jgi:hypothetical protein